MSRAAGGAGKIFEGLSFRGHTTGAFKALRGFKKSFHTVPDAANATTNAFLAKLAADELAEEGETFFQRARSLLDYKRKELALDLSVGAATLSAKDFTLTIAYSLSEDNPAEFVVTRTLENVRSAEFLALPEVDELLGGIFNEVNFQLSRGAPVEKVIDAVEELEGERAQMTITYPSNCATCTIAVPGVDAEVRYAPHELSMIFPRTAAPSTLWASFLAVRHAFALSEDETLSGLIVA
ncbi:MAG TPA: hypothetical protein VFT72_06775 [Opitutaceae bacterium]|nr:hypothetical protein [Opitutaceae bacterium]